MKSTQQTHVRIALKDKARLERFMRRNNIKGQAAALRRIFNKVQL